MKSVVFNPDFFLKPFEISRVPRQFWFHFQILRRRLATLGPAADSIYPERACGTCEIWLEFIPSFDITVFASCMLLMFENPPTALL